MMVFSLIARNSFLDIPVLHDRCLQVKDKDKVPMILVGNKVDLFDKFQVICLVVPYHFSRLPNKRAKTWQPGILFRSSQLRPKHS